MLTLKFSISFSACFECLGAVTSLECWRASDGGLHPSTVYDIFRVSQPSNR